MITPYYAVYFTIYNWQGYIIATTLYASFGVDIALIWLQIVAETCRSVFISWN